MIVPSTSLSPIDPPADAGTPAGQRWQSSPTFTSKVALAFTISLGVWAYVLLDAAALSPSSGAAQTALAAAALARPPVRGGVGRATAIDPARASRLLFLRRRKRRGRPRLRRNPARRNLKRCRRWIRAKRPRVPGATVPPASKRELVRCLIRRRYRRDRRASRDALRIYDISGWVCGLLPPRRIHGGWRGRLKLVPELPVGRHRRHLKWLRWSVRDFRRFFAGLRGRARRKVSFRWTDLRFRFFRSVRRTTPSAMAGGWSVAYNVSGSLFRRPSGVRETLFHEVFHLNDGAHGGWSRRALAPLYRSIVRRCTIRGRLNNRCLKRYAPHKTIIRRFGIYYAFHPQSGVGEYAAELAVRYYLEHRAIILGRRPLRPFKCRAPENSRSWSLLADEFFGGVDLTRRCR